MNKKSEKQRQTWTLQEVNKIRHYALANSQDLISNLLANIVAGYMRFRKHRRFFVDMGSYLGRSPKNCKSKFQTLEKRIYVDTLKVPRSHYMLFCHIRKKQPHQVNYDFTEVAKQVRSKLNANRAAHKNVDSSKSKVKIQSVLKQKQADSDDSDSCPSKMEELRYTLILQIQSGQMRISNKYKG